MFPPDTYVSTIPNTPTTTNTWHTRSVLDISYYIQPALTLYTNNITMLVFQLFPISTVLFFSILLTPAWKQSRNNTKCTSYFDINLYYTFFCIPSINSNLISIVFVFFMEWCKTEAALCRSTSRYLAASLFSYVLKWTSCLDIVQTLGYVGISRWKEGECGERVEF